MNRPKAENHYKDVGGFTYRYETQYTHKTDYERELEAYCDALEKALDKACDFLETYDTRGRYGRLGYTKEQWKALVMKDE